MGTAKPQAIFSGINMIPTQAPEVAIIGTNVNRWPIQRVYGARFTSQA